MIRLLPRRVDAVEIINCGNTDFQNQCAEKYADMYGLIKVAGSDTHSDQVSRVSGLEFNRRLEDINDMISSIRKGEFRIITANLQHSS